MATHKGRQVRTSEAGPYIIPGQSQAAVVWRCGGVLLLCGVALQWCVEEGPLIDLQNGQRYCNCFSCPTSLHNSFADLRACSMHKTMFEQR